MTSIDASPDAAAEPLERQLVRSPTYLLRLVVGLVVSAVGFLITWQFANTAAALNVDWESLVSPLPQWILALPTIIVVLALLVVPVATNIVLIMRRRFRLLLLVDVAAFAAFALSELLVGFLTREPPSQFPDAYIVDGTEMSVNDPLLAGFIAALMIGLPYLRPSLRRLAYWVIGLNLFVTLGFSEVPAVAWVLDVGLGVTCGAAVALIFGTPDSKPTAADIVAAMGRSGIDMAEVVPAAVDARGSTPWFGTTLDGSRLFIKVLNADNRSAELMFRTFRALFLRNTGDERPSSSLRRSVEHEALLSLRATSVDIRTPELVAVSEIGTDGMLLAYRAIDGSSLDGVPADALTDDLLDAVWEQVVELRAAGIAHRDLRLANIFLGDDGVPQLIDFGFAELAASELLLATDVAELMGSTAPAVGVQRAVDAAERAVGREGLREALPRVQPYALGSATRTTLKEEGLFEPLRDEVADRSGHEEVVYEPLDTAKPIVLLGLVVGAVALWAVIDRVAGEPGALGALVDARPAFVLWSLVASAVTYVGATVAMQGSLRDPLPFAPTLLARLASSYSNRLTVARSGGVALSVRYLQKLGVETATALGSVGLMAAAGLTVHLAVLYMTVRLSGEGGSFDLAVSPSTVVVIVVCVALVVGAVVFALPWGRRVLLRTLLPAVRRASSGLRDVSARPRRLVQLFLGSLTITFAYITALIMSVRAFDGTIDAPSIALVFLVATVLAAVIPTPGGLGAVEAALVGGLVILGETAAIAIPAVFVYRIVTFWLPIAPGWLAYRNLERTGRM